MNTNYSHLHQETLQNRFGLRVAARLSSGAEALPHDIGERLRVAREQAVGRRKQPAVVVRRRTASAVSRNGRTATLSFGDDGLGFWGRLASAALVLKADVQRFQLARERDRLNLGIGYQF